MERNKRKGAIALLNRQPRQFVQYCPNKKQKGKNGEHNKVPRRLKVHDG